MTIKVLRKPYNQVEMAKALRDALAAPVGARNGFPSRP
jgi:hypothetical protein